MDKNVTSIAQSEKLLSLGIPSNTASYCWLDCDTNNPFVMTTTPIGGYELEYAKKNVRPCWTLADLLNMLPRATRRKLFTLEITKVETPIKEEGYWRPNDENCIEEWVANYNYLGKADFMAHGQDLIDVVVEMIEWLVSNEELYGTPKE